MDRRPPRGIRDHPKQRGHSPLWRPVGWQSKRTLLGVVARRRHTEHAGHAGDFVVGLLFVDQPELHLRRSVSLDEEERGLAQYLLLLLEHSHLAAEFSGTGWFKLVSRVTSCIGWCILLMGDSGDCTMLACIARWGSPNSTTRGNPNPIDLSNIPTRRVIRSL